MVQALASLKFNAEAVEWAVVGAVRGDGEAVQPEGCEAVEFFQKVAGHQSNQGPDLQDYHCYMPSEE